MESVKAFILSLLREKWGCIRKCGVKFASEDAEGCRSSIGILLTAAGLGLLFWEVRVFQESVGLVSKQIDQMEDCLL